MLPGYHIVGLLEHDSATALRQLASIGYQAAAVRLHRCLFDADRPGQFRSDLDPLAQGRAWAESGDLTLVIDADGRFLVDPWDAEGPCLMAIDAQQRRRRQQIIERAIELAAAAGAALVTFSCGQATAADGHAEQLLETLADAVAELLDYAQQRQVRLAVRPALGGCVATVAHFERLLQWLPAAQSLMLAADVASMVRQGELPVLDFLDRQAGRLGCVYLSDLRAGEPGDQRIGRGEVAVRRIAEGLGQRGYGGPVIVRVEGHAAEGLAVARQAYADVFG